MKSELYFLAAQYHSRHTSDTYYGIWCLFHVLKSFSSWSRTAELTFNLSIGTWIEDFQSNPDAINVDFPINDIDIGYSETPEVASARIWEATLDYDLQLKSHAQRLSYACYTTQNILAETNNEEPWSAMTLQYIVHRNNDDSIDVNTNTCSNSHRYSIYNWPVFLFCLFFHF